MPSATLYMWCIPLELLPTIIGHDWEVYWALAMAIPSFGRSTLATQTTWRARFTRVIEDKSGKRWLLAGKMHRDDGPAWVCAASQSWYQYGLNHRDDDLPAYIGTCGVETTKMWCQRGVLCRDGDKPAKRITYSDGRPTYKTWYQDNKLHRDGDLPASVCGDQSSWYQHGELHRDGDKPATIWATRQFWYKRGKLHREGRKPAIIGTDGTKKYYIDGVQRWYPSDLGVEPP